MSDDDLFAAHAKKRLESRGPLAARLRPRSLDEVIGQAHLVGPGGALRVLAESDRLTSVILWGPPGSGKTTLASLLAEQSSKAFIALSAVSSGVAQVREVIEGAKARLGEQGQGTVLFLDEVHRFNKSQQDLLLPSVEDGLLTLIGATTENPYFEVNAPLLSRSTLWRLEPLTRENLEAIVGRGLAAEDAQADEEAIDLLVGSSEGDARALLTTLEGAVALAAARESDADVMIVAQDVIDARDGRVLHQGQDEHYDQVSAMIKSIRGSDADAGLYWMSRLLEAGESPRFIARRLVILASEDIGMADPNRVTLALGRARQDVREGPLSTVPAHLRDGHYKGAKEIGHGVGYRYPHDEDAGWVAQQYLPEEIGSASYYQPSEHGRERNILAWLEESKRQGRLKSDDEEEEAPR